MTTDKDKYQTGSRRFLAAIIDSMITILPIVVITSNINMFENLYLLYVLSIIGTFLPIFYSVFMHFKFGQTIGKIVANVRVIDLSEIRPISFKQAFLRESIWIGLTLSSFALGYINSYLSQAESLISLKSFIDSLVSLWFFIEVISIFINKKRRSINDLVANTVVVKFHPEDQIFKTVN